ncbi:hypothetical protein VOLCADRAFT_101004, partial [Volvox carteri f. nagariensis]
RVYRPPRVFRDAEVRESVCLLLERTRGGRFVAGWAWLAVRPEPAAVGQLAKSEEEEEEEEEGHELASIGAAKAATRAGALATAAPGVMDDTQPSGTEQQRRRRGRQQQQQQLRWVKAWVGVWYRVVDWWFRSSWVTALWGFGNAGVEVGMETQAAEDEEAVAVVAAVGGGGFRGGWSPRGGRPLRRLHLGAPHPSFEGPVDLQAVALFRGLPSLARSVVVSGKHRRATAADSACLPGFGYPASDPSHNDRDAFNIISFALLQLHGKKEESCPVSTVFASGGFGSNATAFYSRKDTAVAALVAALEEVTGAAAAAAAAPPPPPAGTSSSSGGWTVSLPPDDPACALTATRNVFGRGVNGVPRRDVCTRPADAGGGSGGRSCFGSFVHVEQAEAARAPAVWALWVEALQMLQSWARVGDL